jgi:hypothetical protein
VIDDLTIENKKLRERLRRYERSHSSHLEKDKLFEVKVHALDPRKKRELEETLHAFASSISKDESTSTSTSLAPVKDSRGPTATARHTSRNPSSLSTSNSRFVDSAYASLSTSGALSSSASNNVGIQKKKDNSPLTVSKEAKVQSFLDDIPPGLFPKHSTVMSERSKKKLVVRRLEQLFTGNIKIAGGSNSQPLQQQGVSESAAQDDRRVIESRGQQVSAEGLREAHILSREMELERAVVSKLPRTSSTDSGSQADGSANSTDTPSSPNQRPTRPLDLDPDRAQVPADNMEYIRHLGISTPDMVPQDFMHAAAEDGHGWVYLNLLINMAQLHIINVTPDFVRSAVTELSTKFQLSQDGSKIRWRGGTEGTELTSDSGGDNALRFSPSDSDSLDEGSKKRRKLDNEQYQRSGPEQTLKQGRFSAVPIAENGQTRQIHFNERQNTIHYKPLFAHQSSSQEDEMSLDDSASQDSFVVPDKSGTGITSNPAGLPGRRSQSSSSSKRKRTDGAIVFYSGAQFCTDLSGDREDISTPIHVDDVGVDGFSNHSHNALGCQMNQKSRPSPSRSSSGSALSLRPLRNSSIGDDPLSNMKTRSETFDSPMNDMADFDFSPQWTAEEQQGFTPLSLDACGLGGTRPADHFAVMVKTRRRKVDGKTRMRLSKFSAPGPKTQRFFHNISKSSLDLFRDSDRTVDNESGTYAPVENGNSVDLPLRSEIISTRVQHLEPSDLPPPATYHGTFTSSTEWSGDTSSDDDRDERLVIRQRSRFAHWALSSASLDDAVRCSNDDEDVSEEDIEESDTSSIDMLAHARGSDPQSVAAREQQYEREAMAW